MRYLFHVHKLTPAWRLVIGEGFTPPAGHTMDEWEHTRTRDADDVTPDVRRDVAEQGYCLFKLGGTFADVAADIPGKRSSHVAATSIDKVVLAQKLALIQEHWRPQVVGELNGQEVKLVKFQGAFVWHHHGREDELFLGIRGHFRVEFRDRVVEVGPGEFIIVPRGLEHRTVAEAEAEVLVFEPAGTRNTGNIEHAELTAPTGVRI